MVYFDPSVPWRWDAGVDQVFRGGLWEEGIQPLEAKGAARVLGEECFQQRNLEGKALRWAGPGGQEQQGRVALGRNMCLGSWC